MLKYNVEQLIPSDVVMMQSEHWSGVFLVLEALQPSSFTGSGSTPFLSGLMDDGQICKFSRWYVVNYGSEVITRTSGDT